MKVGVCYFDDPKLAIDGWASVAGDSAYRIQGTQDLASDVFWVTNLDYYDYRKLQLTSATNIATQQYFRTKLFSIIEEVGSLDDADAATEQAAKILNRTAILGDTLFGAKLGNNQYRYANTLQSLLQSTSMRAQPKGEHAFEVAEALRHATQENQAMSSRSVPQGSKAIPFVFPRAGYAKWLLSQKYPSSPNWQRIATKNHETSIIGYEAGNQIKGTKSFIERLETVHKKSAAIFKVTVLSTDPTYAAHSTFGAGKNNIVRQWATVPEIIELAKHCKLAIDDGYHTKKDHLDIKEKIDTEELEYSISKGLLLENVWVAIGTPQYSKENRFVSAIAAYMRAYDRIACSRAAIEFEEHGFIVGSYGVGRVLVYVRPGEEHAVKEVALNNNLVPPARFI
ncbi:hypothetical protein AB4254_11170 [Vibrio breoganii]